MQQGNPSSRDVVQAASRLGKELTSNQADGLAAYLGLLQTWNRKMNLVGPARWPEMLECLVSDSWHLADLLAGLDLPPQPATFDFGAGAGIPGVPLRLFWGAGEYLLIEPRAKRAGFLRQCLAELRLPGTKVFEGRADALGGQSADICLSRAFQPWRDFLETARGFWRAAPQGCASANSDASSPDAASMGAASPGAASPGAASVGAAGAAIGNAASLDAERVKTVSAKVVVPDFTGLAVVFANDAEPDGLPPEGYSLVAARAYPSRGKTGYFWVFAPSISKSSESLKINLVAS